MEPEPAAAPASDVTAPPEAWTTVVTHDGRKERRPASTIQPFDCGHPSVLTSGQMRRLRQRQEQFARTMAGTFSIHLRTEFTARVLRLQTLSYQRLVESLPAPTHLSLFKADPLKGVGIIEVSPRLALLIVDRLLGGPGQAPVEPGELTDLEITLLDQAVQIVLNEWCAQWRDMQELRAVPLGHENNARFLQTSPGDAAVLLLSMEMTVGTFSDRLQIAVPVATLEPLLHQLEGPVATDKPAVVVPPQHPRWNRQLDDLQVSVTAEWQGLQLTARELARLQAGDVLMLPSNCASEVHLRVGQLPKFAGRLGTRGSHWAVQVTGPTKS